MSWLTRFIDRRFYGKYSKNWDDDIFRQRIISVIETDSHVLDLGAGAGIVSAMNFRGRVARICGVDVDPRVVENPLLDEGKIADASGIPYPNQSFDIVFADNVVEHLEDPVSVFSEVHRVLKPGGVFLFKTPNKYHYMPLIARSTPVSFHKFINKIRGRAAEDTFPTVYRANCPRDVRRVADEVGFDVAAVELIEGRQEYLRMFSVTYLVGLLYERLVNRFDALSRFRILMIATLKRP